MVCYDMVTIIVVKSNLYMVYIYIYIYIYIYTHIYMGLTSNSTILTVE